MAVPPHPTLTHIAQQAAAQIGFTVRRWWREKTDPQVLRVEVERCLVGARPAIAVLTVAIPGQPVPQHPSSAHAVPPSRPRPRTCTTGRTTRTQRTARSPKR
jgi:hypothetical protein